MPHFLNNLLKDPGAHWVVKNARTGAVVVDVLETAFDSSSRRRGLLGRSELARGAGLVIAPSNAVHTFSMRFPIDIIFVARDGHVVKVRRHVGPRRIAAALSAFAVIELPAGSLDATTIAPGDVLAIVRCSSEALSGRLR
jgi:uncharacterized membrane protein (UPF0127 family)